MRSQLMFTPKKVAANLISDTIGNLQGDLLWVKIQ
jgi:hypothetical protein